MKTSLFENVIFNMILAIVGLTIFVTFLFENLTGFYPNWSSLIGIPSYLGTALNGLITLAVIVLIFGVLKIAKGGSK